MPQHRIGAELIVGSGQIASSNNGFDPQIRTWAYSAVGFRTREYPAVGFRTWVQQVNG